MIVSLLRLIKNKLIMKKIIFVFALATGILLGCDNEEDDMVVDEITQSSSYTKIGEAEYPDQIVNYVSQNYTGETIVEMYLKSYTDGSQVYDVALTSQKELYFDDSGNYLGMDDNYNSVIIDDLPETVITYIADNYPEQTIVKAEMDTEDGIQVYNIYLNNGMELYFDLNGNFIKAENDNKFIDTDNLPQSILDYISTNYPNEIILYAEEDREDGVLIYEVNLTSGYELEFDSNGNLLEAEQNIPLSDLPQAIIDYVDTNYPNNFIDEAEFEFEDGQQVYKIELDNDIELYFDLDGNFLFMEQD